ncbi:MAG TPA: heme biosynthesis HemY N-terminal domain-containing protein [Burkholderiales bacterium]|nr:heme biosynthesis HemY N-terminal domain-containing protein [Burkholderiales bacterium]
MRILVWILLIFALAVGFTLAGKFDPGYAILVYPPYRIELSLVLLIILLLLIIVLGNLLVRVAAATLTLPQRARAFRQRQRQLHGNEALMSALTDYLEQRYKPAETAALSAHSLNYSPYLAALLAAAAAEAQNAHDRRDQYLALAAKHAASPDRN